MATEKVQEVKIKKVAGDKSVALELDEYGDTTLLVCRNGFQTFGVGVDATTISLLREVLAEWGKLE